MAGTTGQEVNVKTEFLFTKLDVYLLYSVYFSKKRNLKLWKFAIDDVLKYLISIWRKRF